MARSARQRVKINFNVRRNSTVFDFPIAVKAIDSGSRRGNVASVDQFRITSNADQSAPGLLADQRADGGFAEVPRQCISSRTGHFIDEQDLGTVDRLRRAGPVVAFAGHNFAH